MTCRVLLLLLVSYLAGDDASGWSAQLPGQWVGVEKGDAVQHGKLVDGGARVRFVEGQGGSRTPWNLSFLAPRDGHREASTVGGGCGFYPSGKAWCRGYGVSDKGKAMETTVAIEQLAENRVRLTIAGLLPSVEIIKE